MNSFAQTREFSRQSGHGALRLVLRLGGCVTGGKQVPAAAKSLYCGCESPLRFPEFPLLGADFIQLAAEIGQLPVSHLTTLQRLAGEILSSGVQGSFRLIVELGNPLLQPLDMGG